MTAEIDPAAEVVVGVDSHAEAPAAVAVNGLGQVLATTPTPPSSKAS